jgi:hypothetical protein
VLQLLQRVAPACPNLEGITFEFHESVFPHFGPEALHDELRRLGEAWATRGCHVA